MNKKKSIAVAIVLVLVLAIGGMLAYFTDTDEAKNTFTIGKNVNITLEENQWHDEDAQNILPGATINKNPTVKVDKDSSSAYVFVTVTVPCYDKDKDGTVDTPLFSFVGLDSSDWTEINTVASVDTTKKSITHTYAYTNGNNNEMKAVPADGATSAVFNGVKLDENLTDEQRKTADGTSIDVKAYGIQTENLGQTDPAEIFKLFTPAE